MPFFHRDRQVASVQMNRYGNMFPTESFLDGCCHAGTGAGSAGHGDMASPLPDPHPQLRPGKDLDKLRIHPARKKTVMFHQWTYGVQRKLLCIIHKKHDMWIADRDRYPIGKAGACKSGSLQVRFGYSRQNKPLLLLHLCFSHLHRHRTYFSAADLQFQIFDPGQCLHRQIQLIRISFVINVLSYAADPVSAHICLAAIRIEDPHPEICCFRRSDIDHAVRTGTEMAL